MQIFTKYVVLSSIKKNDKIHIFKGCTVAEKKPVIVKMLKKEAADSVEIAKLIHEYEITRELNIEGILKPLKLERSDSAIALVMADAGLEPLKKYVHDNPLDILEFLRLGIKLVQILDQVHQKDIIHGNLNPENILIHPATRDVYITDFSWAIDLKKRNNWISNSSVGSYEYIAPEQTGRLKVATDQRSDLYSLGVIFYELVTGQLPFQGDTPSQLIYAHLTNKPGPPSKIKPNIPYIISEIIMKLMAKDVEERYWSAYGLYWDLKECVKRLAEGNILDVFSLGQADLISHFRLPDKFYGRIKEQNTIKAVYDQVCKGEAATVLVSGNPGIGKTMLIKQCFRQETLNSGRIITGKFDQLERNIPYAAFADAFRSLVRQLISEGKAELERWKKRILLALGRNAAVITEVIPELEWLIGKQPPVDVLSPKEAENRFFMVFRHFIKVFARKKHPLVLFLDDLQWADLASIHLLNYLSRDEKVNYLLIIGAFRENEVDEKHPLTEMLNESFNNNNSDITLFSLLPLELKHVKEMVTDTFNSEREASAYLAGVLYRKTGGNPFYIRQFLTMAHDEKLLFFDKQEGCWKWDLDTIRKLQPGDDILQLLMKKLERISGPELEILKLAACIGYRFRLETLAAMRGESLRETISRLIPLIQEGLILPLTTSDTELPVFEFLHDRIQQAVYTLTPEEERKKRHLAVGRFLLKTTKQTDLEEKILFIMDHLNNGIDLLVDPSEKLQWADYNLLAGRKAKASAAYASALHYFRIGVTLLPDNAWKRAYQLSYDLHLELAQAEWLSANFQTAEKLFSLIIKQAGSEIERARVYSLKVLLYASAGKYSEAVQTGIKALADLGVKLSLRPSWLDYAREMFWYKWYMWRNKIENLIYLPEMKDPVQVMISELLLRLSSVTISSYPDFYGLVILRAGNHAARYGISDVAPVGFFGYSFVTANILNDYESGEKLGEVCIQLVEKYNKASSKCVIYFVVGAFITHWTQHAKFSLDYLKTALRYGLETGDVLIIGYAHCLLLEIKYLLGTSLDKLLKVVQEKHEIARKLKHDNLVLNAVIYEKLILALQQQDTISPTSIAQGFRKENILPLVEHDRSSLATFYFCKMQLHYLAGDYQNALLIAQTGLSYYDSILGFLQSAEYYYYYSLVITAIYNKLTFWHKKFYWLVLKKNLRKLRRWAKSCRENFLHKYLLVVAELARLKNKEKQAIFLYNQAIRLAGENGYIQDQALSNELAAKYCLALGQKEAAKTYMLNSYLRYKKWGAIAKANQLKKRYYDVLEEEIAWEKAADKNSDLINNFLRLPSTGTREVASSVELDFVESVVDSISKEADLNKIVENFLNFAIHQTGADRAYLIIERDGELFIEASQDSNFKNATIKNVFLNDCQELSKAVVRYVFRTLETIILDIGEENSIFAGDPYFAKSGLGSIACFPLLFQGIPFGVLYLENSQMSKVFSKEHLKIVKILFTQIACMKIVQPYLKEGIVINKANQGGLVETLTEREQEVLNLIANGMSNKEIADKLGLTINTVKGYIKNVYAKLGVNRRVQVVTKAKEYGLLQMTQISTKSR